MIVKAYNAQRNLCVSVIRQAKKNFFSKLNTSDVTDKKTFWRTVKPFLTDKVKTKSKITLIEKTFKENSTEYFEEIISGDKKVADVFNDFFINIVPNLEIETDHNCNLGFQRTGDLVLDAINKYKCHSSINMTKSKIDKQLKFSFTTVQHEDILKKIKSSKVSKASQQSDIPTRILIDNSEYFASYFHENISYCLGESLLFPHDLKLADVTPAYKKKSRSSKDYRPVSILSNISKIYERCIYDQIQNYFDQILSKYQCGFRKGYNAQHCLITLIEKCKKGVDNGGAFSALLTDLSKAFDCVSHELLIVKLNAYGFDKRSLTLSFNYLSIRKHRLKINDSFSSWSEILFGVPQGSILGPLLFNIFICDMFYFMEDYEIANYADDSTPFSTKPDHKSVVQKLEVLQFYLHGFGTTI